MGVGGGGNKLRKLEFLFGEALARQCDTFITTGGIQSNHARLSAAVAARMGLSCELVLARVVPRDEEEYRRNGNVLLDGLFGATIHELPGDADALAFAEERAAELRNDGRRPYVVGLGGSTPIGCLGYAACAQEIVAQEEAVAGGFARIVLPNGSSGTHAGLAAGLAALGMDPARAQSFAISAPADAKRRQTYDLACATLALLSEEASIEWQRSTSPAISSAGIRLAHGRHVRSRSSAGPDRRLAARPGLWRQGVRRRPGGGPQWRLPVRRAISSCMTGGTPGLCCLQARVRSGLLIRPRADASTSNRTAARGRMPPPFGRVRCSCPPRRARRRARARSRLSRIGPRSGRP